MNNLLSLTKFREEKTVLKIGDTVSWFDPVYPEHKTRQKIVAIFLLPERIQVKDLLLADKNKASFVLDDGGEISGKILVEKIR